MKRLLVSVMLLLPLSVFGAHMDVLEFELKDGCSFSTYMGIVNDFNSWGKEYGYEAKIAVPLQSEDLTVMYWLGTSADVATFGKAWDTWRDALNDPNSTPAKLSARFTECSDNISRQGYDIY